MTYVRPNYYWSEDAAYETADFVRLAYNISLGGENHFVHVDALTNEVIGGDMKLAANAGVFADLAIDSPQRRANLASSKLSKLGYNIAHKVISDDYSTKTKIMNFLQSSNAKAFYFTGHGHPNKISSGNGTWSLNRTTIDGYNCNPKFVFLSCCEAGTASWAKAFNITNSSKGKGFVGFMNKIDTKVDTEFNEHFWSQIAVTQPATGQYGTIYNATIYAKNATGADIAQGYFSGDKTYNGKA